MHYSKANNCIKNTFKLLHLSSVWCQLKKKPILWHHFWTDISSTFCPRLTKLGGHLGILLGIVCTKFCPSILPFWIQFPSLLPERGSRNIWSQNDPKTVPECSWTKVKVSRGAFPNKKYKSCKRSSFIFEDLSKICHLRHVSPCLWNSTSMRNFWWRFILTQLMFWPPPKNQTGPQR